MATMNVSLPDPLRDFVQQRIDSGQYASVSDYVRDLIRHDQNTQRGVSALQAAIDEGFASGTSNRTLDEILADAKGRASKLTAHGS